jgi:hypothetical protein
LHDFYNCSNSFSVNPKADISNVKVAITSLESAVKNNIENDAAVAAAELASALFDATLGGIGAACTGVYHGAGTNSALRSLVQAIKTVDANAAVITELVRALGSVQEAIKVGTRGDWGKSLHGAKGSLAEKELGPDLTTLN